MDVLNKDYKSYLSYINNCKYSKKELHHILSLQIFWPDIHENKAIVWDKEHVLIHQAQDIPYRYRWTMIRNQRIRENWHIVLTNSDLEWRRDIQWLYLEWSAKLPNALQDMNLIKLLQLTERENKKLMRMWVDPVNIDTSSLLKIHWSYIDIQKEISKRFYKLLTIT